MEEFKDRMYNYEVTPPPQNWQIIVTALDQEKTSNSGLFKKRSKIFYFSLTAAAVLAIFVFSLIFWENSSREKINKTTSTENNYDDKITVPKMPEHTAKKYITIVGSQGQCVKISSKAAMLIVASDNQNPPKPVWSAKVNKWKDIMESNTLAPTTTNFLDIVELTHTLRVDN